MIGYSDGRHILNDDNFTSGGQCEDGLKMIILIGDSEVEVLTSESDGNSNLVCHYILS